MFSEHFGCLNIAIQVFLVADTFIFHSEIMKGKFCARMDLILYVEKKNQKIGFKILSALTKIYVTPSPLHVLQKVKNSNNNYLKKNKL